MLTFFTPFDVKMIQISTFPAAPSTERVPSLAERVASLRYLINLQFLNNRVPALVTNHRSPPRPHKSLCSCLVVDTNVIRMDKLVGIMVHFAGSPSSSLLIPTPSSLLARGGFESIIQSFFDDSLIVLLFKIEPNKEIIDCPLDL